MKSNMKLMYALDLSKNLGQEYVESMLKFVNGSQALFIDPASNAKLILHGYGDNVKDTKSLTDTATTTLSASFNMGEFAPTLDELLENVRKSTRRLSSDSEKGLLVIFVSKKVLNDEKTSASVKNTVEDLKQKGYKVLVIGTSPKFVEKEFTDFLPKVNVISQPNGTLPDLVDDVERSIGDILAGNFVSHYFVRFWKITS